MTSEPGQGDTMASIRYTIEPSSPLSSCPPSPLPSPPRKRSVSPAPITSLPDTEATKKLSNLELDGKNDPPAKKRAKLTPAQKVEKEKEKEERKRDKEEKEKEKAKIKAEKDEQKRLKDEEKAKKDLEKAAEKAKRDEEKAKRDEEKAKREVEKAKKDEEKAKKEEEKLKKERAQLRMDSFFRRKAPAVPVAASISTATLPTAAPAKTTDNPTLRLIPGNTTVAVDVDMLDSSVNRDKKSDYTKTFQPFFVRPGVKLAPLKMDRGVESNYQAMDKVLFKSITASSDEMDIDDPSNRIIVDSTIPEKPTPSEFKVIFGFQPSKWKKGSIPTFSTKQILAGLNSSPIPDIFSTRKTDNTDYVTELRKLSRKILKYAEDVRPAYRGTYTRVPITSGLRKGRNPFQKSLPGVEYGYDSEAEWVHEPDDDGEDIMSEEDEDPMETGSADEMEDFLDDEEEIVKKKTNLAGPLIPAASGLMWEDECPRSDELMHYRIGVLIEGGTTPIDPFSMKYWTPEKRKLTPQSKAAQAVPEKEKGKAPVSTWWTAASQQSHHATSSTLGPALQPAISVSQSPGGQAVSASGGPVAPRYGQNIPPPPRNPSVVSRNGLGHCWNGNQFDRSSSATRFSDGTPYIQGIQDLTARAALSKHQEDAGPVTLLSLADPEYARKMGIPPPEHHIFFSIYHNLDYCGFSDYALLEECRNFIVGNDATRVGMLEALKKMFNQSTKSMLKSFMNSYCNRLCGENLEKRWYCVFRKNEYSYWELDPKVCRDIRPGQPMAPDTNQAGPSQES
ncbi:chromatin assembly factor-I (CAF-I) p90 subunit [Orbilia oligospora]|nr:chromatin assembly factor-I (CAF-I) p90 subunit [Orbilia oligospora]KAF3238167.1 chromatin assembly factor-I (CAF-I) p90 subunit [Orbilia oligospora]KAF3241774.1 chromatin assembly factor-I (CAF-I) p90 subunit [Orbilia oligospora]